MCLILFAYKCHKEYFLILAANRDEYYDRETEKVHLWTQGFYAGKDKKKGGTWLAISKSKRIAALTNFRDPKEFSVSKKSRGKLVTEFVETDLSPENYISQIRSKRNLFNGYNLILGSLEALYCYSSFNDSITPIKKGIFGLSNHLFDTNWPKVAEGKMGMKNIIGKSQFRSSDLFEMLYSSKKAKDVDLPDTGIGKELEKSLSSRFIQMDIYGTVSSSLVLIKRQGEVRFEEKTYVKAKEQDFVSFVF